MACFISLVFVRPNPRPCLSRFVFDLHSCTLECKERLALSARLKEVEGGAAGSSKPQGGSVASSPPARFAKKPRAIAVEGQKQAGKPGNIHSLDATKKKKKKKK
uniref:Uncharacterized protein n=1 Tax=Odontella aurita TaxID=265563 RepID=A0A7S4IWG2_9STRA|mmetsp:Transcript_31444/g.94071  ORF Transcript_31444/g.94071 Transcript_31444/m.94071 type:complete len:104 (+) Transcript_31444:57-368(+)